MPKRIQMSRKKGWRKPYGAVSVVRPGKWGNPFVVGKTEEGVFIETREQAVTMFRDMLADERLRLDYDYPGPGEIVLALRGSDLMCWCPLDQPCHADVLLGLANAPLPGPREGEGNA